MAVGLTIELIQAGVGRSPNWHDIWLNHLGVLGAWFLMAPPTRYRTVAMGICCAMFLWELVLIGQVVREHSAIQRQKPVIAWLEHPNELERWSGNVILTDRLARHGSKCLEVQLDNGETYSGSGASRIPHDWRGFDKLVFELHLEGDSELQLTLRIHDRAHNQRYDDRFNTRIAAKPGWNHIEIPLDSVISAPHGRDMNMAEVIHLGLFATRLDAPRVIHLDYVRLE
jgi:hypothetical protein